MKTKTYEEQLIDRITSEILGLDPEMEKFHRNEYELVQRIKHAVWDSCPLLPVDADIAKVRTVVTLLIKLQLTE